MEMKFCSECVVPTKTLTKGSVYDIIREVNGFLTIKNDHGNEISVHKYRFDKLQLIEVEDSKKVLCINSKNFKFIFS